MCSSDFVTCSISKVYERTQLSVQKKKWDISTETPLKRDKMSRLWVSWTLYI